MVQSVSIFAKRSSLPLKYGKHRVSSRNLPEHVVILLFAMAPTESHAMGAAAGTVINFITIEAAGK